MNAPDQLRDHGMQQARDHADPRIVLAIDAAIDRAIASRRPFTVNDIRDQFPTITSAGLVGDRFRAASMRRPARMVQTGKWPKSNLPSTRSARVAEWVGVTHGPADYQGRTVCLCGDFNCASLDGAA